MDLHSPLVVPDDVRALVRFLDQHGTFYFPTLPNGLFCAANATHSDFEASGYQNIWLRDNVHIAHAHYVLGDCLTATRAMSAILSFYRGQQERIRDLIEGRLDPHLAMNRPHIRFDGQNLTRLEEQWAHAQNDALGYFLWLTGQLIRDRWLAPAREDIAVLCDLVHVLETVRYWEDEDSGHWEEARKIEASSIGAAVAGLREIRRLLVETDHGEEFQSAPRPVSLEQIDGLLDRGQRALGQILPAECIQPEKQRDYDAALLFLIYPLGVVQGELAERIVDNVRTHLQGEYGIRRYPGDSYWCADYRTLLSADTRTADFSDDMSSRDALLKPGEEAQWCIFDPIVSILFGRKFLETGDREALALQREYLARCLGQLTPPDSRFGAYRCPESYFLERGRYVPNDLTPLLWTQANFRLALAQMEQSLDRG